jgi:chorismate synthase
MSSFGTLFRVTTFGESHCKGVGAIVEGAPPGMCLTEADIQPQLTRRRPGQSKLTTPRDEKDAVSILSGTENGRTLGTPIALFVENLNIRPADYSEMQDVPRPGHADYTYQVKYGIRASSGGGRASARETIGRVGAGAIAEKWLLEAFDLKIVAWVSSVGDVEMPESLDGELLRFSREDVDERGEMRLLTADKPESPHYEDSALRLYSSTGEHCAPLSEAELEAARTDDLVNVRCPHPETACRMASLISSVKAAEDSVGGVVCCRVSNVPAGWGEPCFDKLEAALAHAMLSLPATKGFEIGSGFRGTRMLGSQHNDPFCGGSSSGRLGTTSNHAGGTLGGISNGADLLFRVAIKPVSTIGRPQSTCDFDGNACVLEAKGRHDPCVLPRAVPLVEAMAALVLADAALKQMAREKSIESLTS